MKCPVCGKELPDHAKFCSDCGTQLNAQPAPAPQAETSAQPEFTIPPVQRAAQQQQTQPTPPPQYQQPQYQPQYQQPPVQQQYYQAQPQYPQMQYMQPPKKKRTGLIVGIVCGSVALVAVIVVVLLFAFGVFGGDSDSSMTNGTGTAGSTMGVPGDFSGSASSGSASSASGSSGSSSPAFGTGVALPADDDDRYGDEQPADDEYWYGEDEDEGWYDDEWDDEYGDEYDDWWDDEYEDEYYGFDEGSDGYYGDNDEYWTYYILPTDSEYLDYDSLYWFTKDDINLIRNEIYARHGYSFQSENLREYFGSQPWYKEDPSVNAATFSTSMLNEYELYNLELIMQFERDMGWRN